MSNRRRARGFSLIEVVVFIVILGIAFAGILILYNRLTTASVDPLVRKQAIAIASSLLEEIQLHAFTYCDPDDTNVYTASSATIGAGGCAATLEVPGTEGAETRSGTPRFDNVSDYHGFSMAPIQTLASPPVAVAGLGAYSASAAVAVIDQDELPTFKTTPVLPAGERPKEDALRITVTATHAPTGLTVTLQSYRTRYAPNTP